MLETWRQSGWTSLVGRSPTDDDWIVPSDETGQQHTKSTVNKRTIRELEILGINKPLQPTHALRSTFLSLVQEDGGQGDFIRKITHTGKTGRAFDLYSKFSW